MLENYKSKNFPLKSPKRKALVLEFLGGNDQVVRLDPDQLPIVFGKADKNPESGQQYGFYELTGDKIARHHFEIDYDKEMGTIKMRNLCRD